MDRLIKNPGFVIKAAALILMLVIPFLLYAAALHHAVAQVNIWLAVFIANMLVVMKKG